ncbi:MAG: alpha/beta hydrolase [Clostridiales bacterium]|nr:alpha/beta hydrolase [Clostridiales bacterium]
MREERFFIENTPAVVYGDTSDMAYLFVHGQCGCKEEGAAFADIACPKGYQVLAIDLPEHGERRGEASGFNPWTAAPEVQAVLAYMKSRWGRIGLRANSIGAHFSMLALGGENLCKALFVSPIVDMEQLITDMIQWAGTTEEQLRARGTIATDFGQTLSWDYLTWERQHPVQNWICPTAILYAGQDNLTGRETVERFTTAHAAVLTVMENGEHWFHTPEQLAVLRAWERENI